MEKISLNLKDKINNELEKELENSLKDKDFCNLVKRCRIPKNEALYNNTKLMDTVQELQNCQDCKGLSMCKNKVSGHVLYPKFDETLKFIYSPCKYQKELVKKEREKRNKINEIANARMKDIDINDSNRVEVIKWLKKFFDEYEKVNTLKGLYLHGNFGSGKTYLISALLNELRIKKNAVVEIVYFPEILRELKEDFSLVEGKVRYYQDVDILLLDDIGAENVTPWSRDEILGTILQYRMNNKLTTFFTSNFTILELEKQLAVTKSSEDLVKARRIVERIKQLSDIKELVSVNRRNTD